MQSSSERSRLRLVAYGFLALLVVLAGIPGYLMLDPSWRPVAVRLACAAIVIAGCLRIVAGVRRSIEGEAPSALDVPPRAPHRRELNERFVRLRDDLVFSTLSRRYFDTQLWPRLQKLVGGEPAPPSPSERRGRRRGPSMAALERLIADIERGAP